MSMPEITINGRLLSQHEASVLITGIVTARNYFRDVAQLIRPGDDRIFLDDLVTTLTQINGMTMASDFSPKPPA